MNSELNNEEVKLFTGKLCHQGELTLIRVQELPRGLEEAKPTQHGYVVGHSETGHHHTIAEKQGKLLEDKASNGFVCYLKVEGEYADLVHHRLDHKHGTIRIPTGLYKVNRQREFTPEGERLAAD